MHPVYVSVAARVSTRTETTHKKTCKGKYRRGPDVHLGVSVKLSACFLLASLCTPLPSFGRGEETKLTTRMFLN
jgi:hypothetical protein